MQDLLDNFALGPRFGVDQDVGLFVDGLALSQEFADTAERIGRLHERGPRPGCGDHGFGRAGG